MNENLCFIVNNSIWLAWDDNNKNILGWTTKEPKYNSGYIEKDIILLYSHVYDPKKHGGDEPIGLNFIEIPKGSESIINTAEFYEREIENFIKTGVFKLLEADKVKEMFIIHDGIIIDHHFIIDSNDIYVVIGKKEMNLSGNKFGIGQKIPLKDIIDFYLKNTTERR